MFILISSVNIDAKSFTYGINITDIVSNLLGHLIVLFGPFVFFIYAISFYLRKHRWKPQDFQFPFLAIISMHFFIIYTSWKWFPYALAIFLTTWSIVIGFIPSFALGVYLWHMPTSRAYVPPSRDTLEMSLLYVSCCIKVHE